MGRRQVSRQASRLASPERASREKTLVLENKMKNLNFREKIPKNLEKPAQPQNIKILQEISLTNSPSPTKMNQQIR